MSGGGVTSVGIFSPLGTFPDTTLYVTLHLQLITFAGKPFGSKGYIRGPRGVSNGSSILLPSLFIKGILACAALTLSSLAVTQNRFTLTESFPAL